MFEAQVLTVSNIRFTPRLAAQTSMKDTIKRQIKATSQEYVLYVTKNFQGALHALYLYFITVH